MKWLEPSGDEMSEQVWNNPMVRCIGVHYCGGKIDVDEYGEPIIGDHVLILFNADHSTPVDFHLPTLASGQPWQRVLDTAHPRKEGADIVQSKYPLGPCSVVVLRSLVEESDVAAIQLTGETLNESER